MNLEKIWGTRTVGDNGALDNGAEELGALGETQTFESTTDGVNQTEPGGLKCEVRLDFVVVYIIGNVFKDLVGLGA